MCARLCCALHSTWPPCPNPTAGACRLVKFSLEQALEFINDDELVELTPAAIRVRKKFLKEHERKRAVTEAARAAG